MTVSTFPIDIDQKTFFEALNVLVDHKCQSDPEAWEAISVLANPILRGLIASIQQTYGMVYDDGQEHE